MFRSRIKSIRQPICSFWRKTRANETNDSGLTEKRDVADWTEWGDESNKQSEFYLMFELIESLNSYLLVELL